VGETGRVAFLMLVLILGSSCSGDEASEAPTTTIRATTTLLPTTTMTAPAPIACDPGQVLSEVWLRIEGKSLLINWTARRSLSPTLHGFYVMIDTRRFQIGVKMMDGDEVVSFVYDFETNQNEYLDPSGTTDGQRAQVAVPLSKLPGVTRKSMWQAQAIGDGTGFGVCPNEKRTIG